MNNKSIERSEQINEWAKAMVKFQMKHIKAEKTAYNPAFRSKYANFESIVSAINMQLADCGLCFNQFVSDSENGTSITTMVTHESGQYVSTTMTLLVQANNAIKNPMQAIGSSITFAKRYCLTAFLGIADGDSDDDSQIVTNNVKQENKLNKFVPQQKPSTDDKIKNMLNAFKGLNVTQEMIRDKLNKDVFKIDSSDMTNLERWYLLVKKGEDFTQLE